MYKYGLGVLMMGVLMSLVCQGCGSGVQIADGGKARAVIVLGEKPTRIERHAADELTKYVKDISGAELKTLQGPKAVTDSRNIILVGRPETNERIKELSSRGLVKVSPSYPGLDGFVIKTVLADNKNYLVLSGSMDRGTLYAAYNLLENFCGVGFFWDGEYVPKETNITFANIDITEKPRFSYRHYMQGCAFSYTTNYWDVDDWKREIDWMAKTRQNYFMPPSSNGEKNKILSPSARITRKPIIEYANRLGIRAESLENNISQAHPAPEKKWKIDREKMKQWAVGTSRRIADQLKAHPERELRISGWAMVFDPYYWTPETTKAYLKDLPKERTIIWDLWADTNPMYKRYDSWFGFPWALAILHHMGNMNQLTGDMWYLSERAREVANTPAYKNCVGVSIQPEDIHNNPLYFHYAVRLGWDPNVSVTDFIRDYARRRYGQKSSANMTSALDELTKSVYTISGWPTPTYQTGLSAGKGFLDFLSYDDAFQASFQRMTKGVNYIQHLEKALDYALREEKSQAQNPLYLNDLADICRAYLREVIDYHIFQAISSYAKGDRVAFDANVKIARKSLDYMEQVLGSRPCFWMSRKIDQAKRFRKKYKDKVKFRLEKPVDIKHIGGIHIPGGRDITDEDLARLIRTFFKKGLGWSAYCRVDEYEIFKMVYHKQTNEFLRILSDSFGSGWAAPQEKKYQDEIKKLFEFWSKTGWDEKEMKERSLAIVDVAERIKADLVKKIDAEKLPRFSLKKEDLGKIGVAEEFNNVSELSLWEEKIGPDAKFGKASIQNGKLSIRPESQSYSLTKKLSIPLGEFPILAFRFQPVFKHKPDIYIHWKDAKSKKRRTRVYGAGGGEANTVDPHEIYLDLGNVLSLVAEKPREVTAIEIRYEWAPKKPDSIRYFAIDFDWIRFAKRRRSEN